MKRYKLGDTIFCVCGYLIMIVIIILNPFNFDYDFDYDYDFDSYQPPNPRVRLMQEETLKFLSSCEIIENCEPVEIQNINFAIYVGKNFEGWFTDGVFTVVDDKENLCEHEFMVVLDYVYDEGITSRYLWLDYDISYYE